jgi:pre-mRNA-splicing helicase BRR2
MPPQSRKPDLSGYQYSAMASLVLTADRSQLPRREHEPTGEPESLVGRIDPKSMGSRAFVDKEGIQKKKKQIASTKTETRPGKADRYRDILEATQDGE